MASGMLENTAERARSGSGAGRANRRIRPRHCRAAPVGAVQPVAVAHRLAGIRRPRPHVGGIGAGEYLAHEGRAGRRRERDRRHRIPQHVDAERHGDLLAHPADHIGHRRGRGRVDAEFVGPVVLVAEHDGVEAGLLQRVEVFGHAVDQAVDATLGIDRAASPAARRNAPSRSPACRRRKRCLNFSVTLPPNQSIFGHASNRENAVSNVASGRPACDSVRAPKIRSFADELTGEARDDEDQALGSHRQWRPYLHRTRLRHGAARQSLPRRLRRRGARHPGRAAWETGCRYFDTAPLYGLGLSETRLNRFLRGKKRDDYVLSTKVGRLLQRLPAGAAHRHRQVLRHAVAPRGLRLQP